MNPVPLTLGAALALALLTPLAPARTSVAEPAGALAAEPAGAFVAEPAGSAGSAATSAAWRLELSELRGAELVSAHVAGDWLLVQDANHGVTALDPSSGRVVWFVQLQAALEPAPQSGPQQLALATPDEIVAVRLRDGRRLGRLPILAPGSAAPQTDGELVYATSLLGNAVEAHLLDGGLQAWSFELPATVESLAWIDLAGAKGLLVADTNGVLRALPVGERVPSHQNWVTRVGRLAGPPLLVGRRILVATTDRVLASLDAASGRLDWRVAGAHDLQGSPVLIGDVLVVGRVDGLAAASVADGRLLWEQDTLGTPLGALSGGRVLVARGDRREVLDAANGKLLAEAQAGSLAVAGRLLHWDAQAVEGR